MPTTKSTDAIVVLKGAATVPVEDDNTELIWYNPYNTVKAGDLLGYEGMTGRASGCHVHYGLFSLLETATFGIDPAVVKRLRVPTTEIARVTERS